MKHNDILTECYIDTTLISSLLGADVNHKFGCNGVGKELEGKRYADRFAVGIIDNDRRQHTYTKQFTEICCTENMTFLKHNERHHYLIKIGKPHKAMETFIMANVSAMGKKMEDFGLPSDLDALLEVTKDRISSQRDSRILKLCKEIRLSPEGSKLKSALAYLVLNRYDSTPEEIKNILL